MHFGRLEMGNHQECWQLALRTLSVESQLSGAWGWPMADVEACSLGKDDGLNSHLTLEVQ